jgi:hypothetical protein
MNNINTAINAAMPETFCWRRYFEIPVACPPTHPDRSWALCY